ncbi:putative nuclease HARBI1 [Myzus persicae]|uniref:putative nuclease HARBI1 n=1 Tax=Myzus persicae TaxID=13164 RepID=UPI000B9316CE|nr:putative nuclease HARBI1 [Myzus persicae]
MTNADRNKAREEFKNAPQPFEGAIGAIDCTYINILAPKDHEEAYVNHHGNHSLNVQAIVSPKLKILNINPRYPGARNDSYVWSTSPIRRAMEYHYNQGERHTWLIGDSGYPLEPWLMTPLPHYREGTRQFKYTIKHCKARNVVERFFGVFKSVWRCLSYQRVLMYAPVMAGKIVNACAVLHNMRIHYRIPIEEENIDNRNINNYIERNLPQNDVAIRGGPRAVAMRIQKQLMQDWFPGYIDGDA